MAGIKINNLPNSTTLSNNDYIITENGVATQKTSIEQIINKVDDESKFNDRIANNLITTEPDLLLDARQGKVLDEKIDTINNKLANKFPIVEGDFTPGGNIIIAGKLDEGFMGFVQPSEMGKINGTDDFSGSNLALALGLSGDRKSVV